MRIKAMPVVRFGDRIPGPVGGFEVLEDDARVAILFRGVAPHVEIAPAAAGRGAAGLLEPRMLIGSMIEDDFSEDANASAMRPFQESLEIAQIAVGRMNFLVIGDVV